MDYSTLNADDTAKELLLNEIGDKEQIAWQHELFLRVAAELAASDNEQTAQASKAQMVELAKNADQHRRTARRYLEANSAELGLDPDHKLVAKVKRMGLEAIMGQRLAEAEREHLVHSKQASARRAALARTDDLQPDALEEVRIGSNLAANEFHLRRTQATINIVTADLAHLQETFGPSEPVDTEDFDVAAVLASANENAKPNS